MGRSSWIHVLSATLLLGALLPPPARALPLAFQGQLVTAADGAAVDDELLMDFRVYDGKAAGAAVLWESLDQPVAVEAGLFVAYLDLDGDLDLQAALAAGKDLWLGVTVGQGAELAGRIALAGSLGTVLAQQSQSLLGCGQGGDGVAVGGQCLQLVTEAELAAAVSAHAGNAAAHHARFTAAEAVTAVNGDINHWTAAHHPDLATIATSGLATDLVGELAEGNIPEDVVRTGDLADVATSGKYGDLDERPDVQSILDRLAALEQAQAATQADNAELRAQLLRFRNPALFPAEGTLVLYVSEQRGGHSSPGTEAEPVKTIREAWDLLPELIEGNVEIRVENGLYPPFALSGKRLVPGKIVKILGDLVNDPPQVHVSGACVGGNAAVDISELPWEQALILQGLRISGCTRGFNIHHARIDIQNTLVEGYMSEGFSIAESRVWIRFSKSGSQAHSTSSGLVISYNSYVWIYNSHFDDNKLDGIYLDKASVIQCSGANTALRNGRYGMRADTASWTRDCGMQAVLDLGGANSNLKSWVEYPYLGD